MPENNPVAWPETACDIRGFHSSTAAVGLTEYKTFIYQYTTHSNHADNATFTMRQITYWA